MSEPATARQAPSPAPSAPPQVVGLTSAQAGDRLQKAGANAVSGDTQHPVEWALAKFCARVPWMLEAAIVLQPVLGAVVPADVRLLDGPSWWINRP